MTARPEPILLTPATEAEWLAWRRQDVTSTEIAALFGVSPYETAFQLWHRKRGTLDRDVVVTERMEAGRYLEPAIAAWAADRLHLTIQPLKQYARHATVPRLGASFDFSIEGGANVDAAAGKGIAEIKNVSVEAARHWDLSREDAEIGEAPAHIELQLQAQLEVLDREYGYIIAAFGGNRLVTIYRERDRVIGAAIREMVTAFWASVDRDEAPAPHYARDAEAIARLYDVAVPAKLLDWRVEAPVGALDLLAEYAALGAAIKDADQRRDAIKAELLTLVGDAEKVLSPAGSLTLSMVGPATVRYERKPYRSFRFIPSRHAPLPALTTPTE